MTLATDHRHLRHLDATQVAHPSGTLAGVEPRTASDETLGSIEGVLVEPACRRLRYFVVTRAAILARRRYLLPAEHLAILSRHDGRIHVEGERCRIWSASMPDRYRRSQTTTRLRLSSRRAPPDTRVLPDASLSTILNT